MKKKIVIISGGFDPLHQGHLEYIQKARKLAGRRGILVAIVNNDNFLDEKKGYHFQDQSTRKAILNNIKGIDLALLSESKDQTVNADLIKIAYYADYRERLIFAKGGDRTADEIPEAALCKRLGIEIVDGLGKKVASSSQIAQSFLDAMEQPSELRRIKYGPLDRVDQEKLSNQEAPEG